MEDKKTHSAEFLLGEKHILSLVSDESMNDICGLDFIENKGKGQMLLGFVTNDVEGLYTKLSDNGVEFVVKPKSTKWGQKVAYFKDPDGNIWEVGDDSEVL